MLHRSAAAPTSTHRYSASTLQTQLLRGHYDFVVGRVVPNHRKAELTAALLRGSPPFIMYTHWSESADNSSLQSRPAARVGQYKATYYVGPCWATTTDPPPRSPHSYVYLRTLLQRFTGVSTSRRNGVQSQGLPHPCASTRDGVPFKEWEHDSPRMGVYFFLHARLPH